MERHQRITITKTNELELIAVGHVIDQNTIRYRGRSISNRSAGITYRQGVSDGQGGRTIEPVAESCLGFGNGEGGRPNGGLRRGKCYALTPEKSAVTSPIISRTIIGDEGEGFPRRGVVHLRGPNGSGHATGTKGTAETSPRIIGGVPRIATPIVRRSRARIATGNIIHRQSA